MQGADSLPVKAVILDRDGTLFNESRRELQPGATELVQRLLRLGLQVFIASNEARDSRVEGLLGLPPSTFLYGTNYGLKGSHGFVDGVLDLAGCQVNELVYLGDSDNDMHEASGRRVALFNAEWSNRDYPYGVAIHSPSGFADCLEKYFLKQHLWYYTVDGFDAFNRPICFRSLLDPDTCKDKGITGLLKNRDVDYMSNDHLYNQAVHLVFHLLGSIYLEGLHLRREPNKANGFMKPLWCIYPGSTGGASPILKLFEQFTTRLLTMTYRGDLLLRHTDAQSSHKLRMSGGATPGIAAQFNTVLVNPTHLSKVKGNAVFVVDDFSTGSNAMETSRNLLYASGAKQVIGISVGKYGRPPRYTACTPAFGIQLPKKGGAVPFSVNADHFEAIDMMGIIDPSALESF